MRRFKKLFSLVLAVTMVFGLISNPLQTQAADADTYVKQLISYYRDYQDAASTDIERVISELKQVDLETGEAWEKIMNYWSAVNQEGAVNIDTVPEGIPTGDNVAIVILGFALNADGTMKDELVGRLQIGLNIANQYTKAYVVVTGGGTAANNPDVTEGGLMGEWLLEQGLDENRLIIENRAPSTVGNAQYTYEILKEEYPQVDSVVLVTSDYHVPRGCAIYYSKFVLDALATGQEPLEIVSNAGYGTGSNGYESYSLQASGVCQVAGISTSSLPAMTLSKLESLTISQDAAYVAGEELDLTVMANYDSDYSKDVTEAAEISGFDAAVGAEQTITVSYTENGNTVNARFKLTETEKTVVDYRSKLDALLEEVNTDTGVYSKATLEILDLAAAYAEEVNANEDAAEEELKTAYETLVKAVDALEVAENIAFKKSVTASHNSAEAAYITDGQKGTYWSGYENGANVPTEESNFVIDLAGIFAVDTITAVPYYGGNERYYHYDISVSTDGESWTKVAEQRSTEDTLEEGATFVLEEAVEARYVKVDGVETYVTDREDINNFHMNEMYVYGTLLQEVEVEEVKTLENLAKYGNVIVDGGTNAFKMTDDSISATNSYWESGNAIASSWCVIELPDTSEVHEIKVVPYYNNASRYYNYEVLVSEDNTEWTSVGKYEETTVPLTSAGQTFTLEEAVNARYVKIAGIGSNTASKMHLVEVAVYGTMNNIALGKEVTANKDAGTSAVKVTDGSLTTYWDAGSTPSSVAEWPNVAEEDLPYVVVNLDGIYELDSVNVMTYRSTSRHYQYRVYTSMDGEEFTLLGQKDDTVNAYYSQNYTPEEGTTARYIKVVGTHNSANTSFHIEEIRATGTLIPEADADYSAVEAAIAKVPEDLSIYTVATVVDLKIALASVEEGLKESAQDEVDAMAAAIEEALAALEKIEVEEPKQEVCEVFPDVDHGAWYEEGVQYVYDKGIMGGSNGLFNPTGNITRAQVVTTLYNLEGRPEVTDYSAVDDLVDVQADQWYTDAVCWAYSVGVANGNSTTKMFNMSNPVTRQQLATFFYNYAEYKNLDTETRGDYSGLAGADEVASYAADTMKWAYGTGLITGSKTTVNGETVYDLKPTGTATRAQMASILQRFCEGNNL